MNKRIVFPVAIRHTHFLGCALVVLVFMTNPMDAQVKLTVEAADTLAFRMKVDGQLITLSPVTSVSVPSLQAGKREVELSFSNGTQFTQVLSLKDKVNYTYGFRETKGSFRLQILSEVNWTPTIATGLRNAITDNGDDEGEEEVVLIEPGGCPDPVSENEFKALKKEMASTTFDAKRLEKMRGYVMTGCVRVDQLRYMLAQLEMEDHKLRLLQDAMGHVYDPSRLPAVLEEFFLEKNRDRAVNIIGGK